MSHHINIRETNEEDFDQIWEIIQEVISDGDTYVFAPDSSMEKMLEFWCGADKHTYVAIIKNKVVGTFFLKENFPDLGSHVANAGYMTAASSSGLGIGKLMGEFSIKEARQLGYKAMQFNMVIKTNEGAIRLWK